MPERDGPIIPATVTDEIWRQMMEDWTAALAALGKRDAK